MPSAYTSLHYHIIFSTKDRRAHITPALQQRLYPCIGGIIRNARGEPIEIGGVADHVHLVARLHPTTAPADIVRLLKSNSSKWIHEDVGDPRFAWQDGYAAFAVSLSNLEQVREYVREQAEHHRRVTFQNEFREFLRRHAIEFDERYIWKWCRPGGASRSAIPASGG